MTIQFPDDFIFGTSTSAYQIETAFEHDWKGVKARDGSVFDRTTDHEKSIASDIEIISSLAPYYRMSLMWSRLQREPYGSFDEHAKAEYHTLLKGLKSKGVNIMMVIYHWANPLWFAEAGGWATQKSKDMFLDFAYKLIDEFGHYVSHWNTFNEPNLYTTLGYSAGVFPPYRNNIVSSHKVARNMSRAHSELYQYIKRKFGTPTGISINCASFSHENIAGRVSAKVADYWYHDYLPGYFEASDFTGISYYARISFDPFPITYLFRPEKMKALNRDHDDIWEYYPEGLRENILRFFKKYRKPVIITENGICTKDDRLRVQSIKTYMRILRELLDAGVDVKGYFHWSTWDNFEWNLGPSFKFGLYECDPVTMERVRKPSADLYSRLAHHHLIEIG